jgi:hypothetical protein
VLTAGYYNGVTKTDPTMAPIKRTPTVEIVLSLTVVFG